MLDKEIPLFNARNSRELYFNICGWMPCQRNESTLTKPRFAVKCMQQPKSKHWTFKQVTKAPKKKKKGMGTEFLTSTTDFIGIIAVKVAHYAIDISERECTERSADWRLKKIERVGFIMLILIVWSRTPLPSSERIAFCIYETLYLYSTYFQRLDTYCVNEVHSHDVKEYMLAGKSENPQTSIETSKLIWHSDSPWRLLWGHFYVLSLLHRLSQRFRCEHGPYYCRSFSGYPAAAPHGTASDDAGLWRLWRL